MQRLILTNAGCAIKSSSSELSPMCFGYVDELTRRLAINQTVRLSAKGYALAVPGLYGGV